MGGRGGGGGSRGGGGAGGGGAAGGAGPVQDVTPDNIASRLGVEPPLYDRELGLTRPVPQSMVQVDTGPYVGTHARSPRGSGQWAFDIDGQTVSFNGSYSQAKAAAVRAGAARGALRVRVLG